MQASLCVRSNQRVKSKGKIFGMPFFFKPLNSLLPFFHWINNVLHFTNSLLHWCYLKTVLQPIRTQKFLWVPSKKCPRKRRFSYRRIKSKSYVLLYKIVFKKTNLLCKIHWLNFWFHTSYFQTLQNILTSILAWYKCYQKAFSAETCSIKMQFTFIFLTFL